jgi:hypothetical protein
MGSHIRNEKVGKIVWVLISLVILQWFVVLAVVCLSVR